MTSATFTVDNFIEYFLFMLGWVLNNGIWDMLTHTGLFAAPFFFLIIQAMLKAREQGDDEGNKGKLLILFLENKLYVAFLVMIFTCLPMFSASFTELEINSSHSQTCNRTVVNPNDSGLKNITSEFAGKQAKIPMWWALTHVIGKGVVHGAIDLLPCKPDLRQMAYEVNNTLIKDPNLIREVENFVNQCYVPARTKVSRYANQVNLNSVAAATDISWIGSQILLKKGGLYDSIQASTANPYWTYDSNRDAGRAAHVEGGYPMCNDWWSNTSVGLRERLKGQVNPSFWTRANNIFSSQEELEDTVIRQLVSPEKINLISDGDKYNSYGTLGDKGNINTVASAGKGIAGGVGSVIGNALTAPIFESGKIAAPMILAFIFCVIITILPFVMIISGYSVKTMITLTIVQLGTFFIPFWWELVRWFDYWFLTISNTQGSTLANGVNKFSTAIFGVGLGFGDSVLNTVVNIMFFAIPVVWLGSLSWAGVSVGGQLTNFFTKSATQTERSTKFTK